MKFIEMSLYNYKFIWILLLASFCLLGPLAVLMFTTDGFGHGYSTVDGKLYINDASLNFKPEKQSRIKFLVNNADWALKASKYLSTVKIGNFGGKWPTWFNKTSDPFIWNNTTVYSAEDTKICLKQKWIMFHGDSSTRMMFSSLVHYLDQSLYSDPYMPKYTVCTRPYEECKFYYKGFDETRSEDNEYHEHYFREYWDRTNNIRITFTFKQDIGLARRNIESFITNSMQPDLLVLQGGCWDGYYHHTVEKTVQDLEWLMGDVRRYFRGKILWMNVAVCHADFKEWAMAFNKESEKVLRKHKIPVLDRQTTTQDISVPEYCEGWHIMGPLCDLHRDWLLRSICS